MAVVNLSIQVFSTLRFSASDIFGAYSGSLNWIPIKHTNSELAQFSLDFSGKPLLVRAKGKTKTESAKIRNRRMRKRFNGTSRKPRLSVFCSDKQLYAMLVDDQNKKCLFYGCTLQKSIRGDPHCNTMEAATRVGEELVKASIDLNINEISSYDRNGFACSERMEAFEIAIAQHGFLPQ